jgi:hypothetical protein
VRNHLVLRRESLRGDEDLRETTIESKTTTKKRTMELEWRRRTTLGSEI